MAPPFDPNNPYSILPPQYMMEEGSGAWNPRVAGGIYTPPPGLPPEPTGPFGTLPSPGAVAYQNPPATLAEQNQGRRSIQDIIGTGFHGEPTPQPNLMPASSLGVPTMTKQGTLQQPQIQPGQMIPPDMMRKAGIAGYHQMLQDLAPTAPVGTYDWNLQEQARQRFIAQQHLGADMSPMPGIGGKILHGLATVGNIAGDILDPDAMANIPGTQLHRDVMMGKLRQELPHEMTAEAAQAEIPIRQAEAETARAELPIRQTQAQIEQQKLQIEQEGRWVPTQFTLPGPGGARIPVEANERTGELRPMTQYPGVEPMRPPVDPLREQVMQDYLRRNPGKSITDAWNATQPLPQTVMLQPSAGGGYHAINVRPGTDVSPAAVSPTQFGQQGGTEAGRLDPLGHPVGIDSTGRQMSEEQIAKAQTDFNKEYMAPLRGLERTVMEFNRINAEKDQSGADRVTALLAAVGISANPLKGEFRVSLPVIEEHTQARSVWEGALARLQSVFGSGGPITPDQVRSYTRIAQGVVHDYYVTAAREAQRQGLPVDFLPRPTRQNQRIDPLTASIYFDVIGGNKDATRKAIVAAGYAPTQ